LAVLTTTAMSGITQTTAVSGGTISYQGASAITARGVCWSTSPNPTIANSITSNGTGIGTFTSNLTGLAAGTTYYVRAYTTNGSGTSYGNQVSFNIPASVPSVTTDAVTLLTSTSASGGVTISSDNGAAVTARGVCWSTTPNPTLANSITSNGTGIGSYTSSLTGLTAGTTYYIRAYATNSIGTAYGNQLTFTTSTPFLLSGGIESTLGNETLMTFNNSGTLTVSGSGPIRVLVVGGGGGGKSGKSNNGNTGGGGAKVVEQYLTLNPGTYTVTVGNGGTAGGGNGGSSVISGVTQTANGGLGNGTSGTGFIPGTAGSSAFGGAATCFVSGGGAGATSNGSGGGSGAVGSGFTSNITGSNIEYGWGGGGGPYDGTLTYTCLGGSSAYISWNNGNPVAVNASPTYTNRGHGGDGGGNTSTKTATAAAGSKGVIIIRYTKVL
jgi:hypothetical protein